MVGVISTSVTFEEAIGIQVDISIPTIGLYSNFTLNAYKVYTLLKVDTTPII